jgi:hypothetical protein
LFFAGEVVEQTAFAEAGFGGDAVKGNGGAPFAFKQREGGAEDVIFRGRRHG